MKSFEIGLLCVVLVGPENTTQCMKCITQSLEQNALYSADAGKSVKNVPAAKVSGPSSWGREAGEFRGQG